MYTLWGARGGGSTAIEAILRIIDAPYDLRLLDWRDAEAWRTLEAINPLRQIPALTADDEVVTESAAIILWLLARHPSSALGPRAGSPEEAVFYRWLVFLAANVYAGCIVGDFPDRWIEGDDAQKRLKEGATTRQKAYWKILERGVEPAPFLLGDRLTALDVYAAMISRWRPGRGWLEAECPKLASAMQRAEAHPIVAEVWARNFG